MSPRIISPVPTGCGAYVFHKMLEARIPGYRVCGYRPEWTVFPPLLPFVSPVGKPSIIHSAPDHALFFSRPSVPLVITVLHLVLDPFMVLYSNLLQRLHYQTDLRWFTKISIRMANRVTAISRFSAAMVKEELGFKATVPVIYPGIDTCLFKPACNRDRKKIHVIFSGNPTRRKGFHWLPDIARRLNEGISLDYTLGLRGKPLTMFGANRVNLGRIFSKDMPALYNASHILLSPTVREGFGLSIAEAMACGLPVVASDCSSIPELVDHGKGGFLCPVGDVNAFAEKINLLADSPRLRKEMGEYNRVKVEKMFTVERMVREYKDLFEEVLG